MRIGICGDVHFSQYSSIVRSMGNKYSTRLEYLIAALNFAESQFEQQADIVIYLGDFFDRENLNSMELTALQEVKWSSKIHYFLVGNHESSVNSLEFNSTSVLKKLGFNIISEYNCIRDKYCYIHFLPYITEDNRKPLKEYLMAYIVANEDFPNIIFSHNDIAGIQYGGFTSKNGFSLDEIYDSCNLYINGHLHNHEKFYDNYNNLKILNLGNLTGQNFSEDAFKYKHQIAILDTQTLNIDYIPVIPAMNFYKIEINKETDIKKLYDISNAVLSIKCEESFKKELDTTLNDIQSHIIAYRTTFFTNSINMSDNKNCLPELNSVDHLKQFKDFILSNLGATDIVSQELIEVCK